MGRGSRQRKGAKAGQKRERGQDTWHADTRDLTTMSNESLEAYYRGNVISDDDWETFLTCMRTPLPTAMRINAAMPAPVIDAVRNTLLTELPNTTTGNVVTLPFVPKQLAIQAPVSRGELKRNAANKNTKQIIAALNDLGYLTRQEAVSMIPPLLLDAQRGDRVLDMCAAPGSKTGQLLEAVMGPEGGCDDGAGCVVANDVNASRMDVLTFQTGRMPGAHAHLIITQHDALQYPMVTAENKFDKVLCDVMCSGDGTLRKSMDLWSRWNPLFGPDLHVSQSRVLLRGMSLCKKGGVVVYSTCSMNPFEDEAVISHCVAQSKGTFRIAETSMLLPGLERTAGRTNWRFLTKDLKNEYATWEEAQANQPESGKGFRCVESMFPNAELLKEQGIDQTIRVLPHQQDTGGFFIAKLECLDDFPDSNAVPRPPRDQELKPVSKELAETVKTAMHLPDDFPFEGMHCRAESCREQKFYYLAPTAAKTAAVNKCRMPHAGAKIFDAFAKYSNTQLRFSIEGIAVLAKLLRNHPRFFATVPPETILESAASAGRLPVDAFLTACIDKSELTELPPKCFIIRCELPQGFGEILLPGEIMAANQIHIRSTERHVGLIKCALGLPLVEPTVESATPEPEAEEEESKEAAEQN